MRSAWIYLSPHFDDVALSCGGLLWEQAQRNESVSVWTICAGNPSDTRLSPFAESLHRRWQTGMHAPEQRREEDLASCGVMGAAARHFDLPDCIYRTDREGASLYASESDIFGPLHPLEIPLIEKLSQELAALLPEDAVLVSPLSLGGHVDHRLVRQAAERLPQTRWYYMDYPYVLTQADRLGELVGRNWAAHAFPLSSAGLDAWQAAIAAHASQISTFWQNLNSMKAAIRSYGEQNAGVVLWRA